MYFDTRMEGFPVAKISQQVIAPALETIRSAAAYAKSIECMNLKHLRDMSYSKTCCILDDIDSINYRYRFKNKYKWTIVILVRKVQKC